MDLDSHCPRCGGPFHCGVNDPSPCACTTLKLDAATRAELQRRYDGCLCLACLVALAAPGEPARAQGAPQAAR